MSLLAILWNSTLRWVCLSFPPLSVFLCSHVLNVMCEASSDSHFVLCISFSWDDFDHLLLYNVMNLWP